MALSKTMKNVILMGIMLFIILVVSVVSFITLKTDPVSEKLKEENCILPVLFVLSDDEGNAMTTNLLLYCATTKKTSMFYIAGNTGAIYSSIGRTDRIDAVYKEKGMEKYCQEISKLMGIEIPFTIDINLSQLDQLVDLLGGIKIFVPSPIDERSKNGDIWLLPSGAVTLDGDKIRTYMSYQLPNEEDSEALQRRQNILISLISGLKENKASLLAKKNFELISDRITSNLDTDGLLVLLNELTNIDTESLEPLSIQGVPRSVDEQILVFPLYNGDLIKEVVEQTEEGLISSIQKVSVSIYNGTNVQGLAHNTMVVMKSANFDVISTANADRSDYEHTVIIDNYGNEEGAAQVANFLHCSYIVQAQENQVNADAAIVDFTIILGADFDGRYVVGGYTPPEETTLEDLQVTDSLTSEGESDQDQTGAGESSNQNQNAENSGGENATGENAGESHQ